MELQIKARLRTASIIIGPSPKRVRVLAATLQTCEPGIKRIEGTKSVRPSSRGTKSNQWVNWPKFQCDRCSTAEMVTLANSSFRNTIVKIQMKRYHPFSIILASSQPQPITTIKLKRSLHEYQPVHDATFPSQSSSIITARPISYSHSDATTTSWVMRILNKTTR